MKLLIITAIKEFKKEILQILHASDVKTFSYSKVTGYRDSTSDSINSNWFATEMNEIESVLFYAFVSIENVDIVMEAVKKLNEKQQTLSQIHVVIVNIEKSN